MDIKYAWPT